MQVVAAPMPKGRLVAPQSWHTRSDSGMPKPSSTRARPHATRTAHLRSIGAVFADVLGEAAGMGACGIATTTLPSTNNLN